MDVSMAVGWSFCKLLHRSDCSPISPLLSAQHSRPTQEYQPTLGPVSISRLENSLNHWALVVTWATSSCSILFWPLDKVFYPFICKSAQKFVSNAAISLVWLWRTTPASTEVGGLFVCTAKLGSVPFVLVLLNKKWCSVMPAAMFMLNTWFCVLLGMMRKSECRKLCAIRASKGYLLSQKLWFITLSS